MAGLEASKAVLERTAEVSPDAAAQGFRQAWWRIGLLGALVITLYADVLAPMASEWWRNEGHSHGLLVVPLGCYLAWRRRHVVFAERVSYEWYGLLVSLLACAMYLLGRLGAELFLSRSSSVVLLAGLVWTFWGTRRLRILAFPLLLLLTAVPLPELVYSGAAMPLQRLASGVATSLSQFLGVAVYRDGNIIQLATGPLGVAEACSGLRSISSLAVSALLLGYLEQSSLWARVVIFLLATPIAILMNVLRITGTAVLADRQPELAMGFYHSFSGWLVFMLGFGLLFVTSKILRVAVRRRHRSGA